MTSNEGEEQERSGAQQAADESAGRAAPPKIERTRFGGTERRPERQRDEPPVSRSDLSKGPAEVIEHPQARVHWPVLLISAAIIIAFSAWAILMPETAKSTMLATVTWIATNLGWYYVVTVTLVVAFVLWVALGKEGKVRLGPDHSRP